MTSTRTVLANHGIELQATTAFAGGPIDVELVAQRPDAFTTDQDLAAEDVAAAVRDLAGPTSPVRLIVDHPAHQNPPLPGRVAARLGLGQHRELHQLRRPLPVPVDCPQRDRPGALPTRPFDVERDRDAWLRQNNRAFADHPDQGQQTAATLEATLREPWVDLAGFLVADDPDRPGELAGSCWTRRHPATEEDPELGEIFVIGVDPTHHGHGLGAHLVLSGLDHLANQGIATAMLYVDADNAPARRLYDRLGFELHLRRCLSAAPAPRTDGRS